IEPAASTRPPAARRTPMTSAVLPPVVITSSTTTAVSPGATVKPRRSAIFSVAASRSVKRKRVPSARATSWPMMRPPRAGETTRLIFPGASVRSSWASDRPSLSAAAGCCSTSAHCRYSALCRPLVRRKWPSRYAPVDRNNSRTDSACGVTDAYYTIEFKDAGILGNIHGLYKILSRSVMCAFDAGPFGRPGRRSAGGRGHSARPERPSAARVHGEPRFSGFHHRAVPAEDADSHQRDQLHAHRILIARRQPVPFAAGRHRAGAREQYRSGNPALRAAGGG